MSTDEQTKQTNGHPFQDQAKSGRRRRGLMSVASNPTQTSQKMHAHAILSVRHACMPAVCLGAGIALAMAPGVAVPHDGVIELMQRWQGMATIRQQQTRTPNTTPNHHKPCNSRSNEGGRLGSCSGHPANPESCCKPHTRVFPVCCQLPVYLLTSPPPLSSAEVPMSPQCCVVATQQTLATIRGAAHLLLPNTNQATTRATAHLLPHT
jgi:hypothetical protein